MTKLSMKCFENHYYKFGNKVYKQSKGGSIGTELTGEVAKLYMLRWDQKFLRKLKQLGIKQLLYKRYVDDILLLVGEIEPGTIYDQKSNKLAHDESKVERDQALDKEVRTMEIIVQIAESIDKDL